VEEKEARENLKVLQQNFTIVNNTFTQMVEENEECNNLT